LAGSGTVWGQLGHGGSGPAGSGPAAQGMYPAGQAAGRERYAVVDAHTRDTAENRWITLRRRAPGGRSV